MFAPLSRRKFIKTALSTIAATSCFSHALNAKMLTQYYEQFNATRKPSKREPPQKGKRFSVKDFGATGNGLSLDTGAIQATIQAVVDSGESGVVWFPAGIYYSGTLHLSSNISLELDKDAVLLGSTDIRHYETDDGKVHALIEAHDCDNIGIFGQGTINAQGRKLALNINRLHHAKERIEEDFNARRNRSRHRPNVIAMHSCNQIKIYDITVQNGASWVQHYAACRDLHIDNIVVQSDAFWNNDGIDINDCEHVRITGCFVNAADDAICLKSTTKKNMRNNDIFIGNCTLRSSSNGIKFGTESQNGFHNVKIEDIVVFDTYRSAIALETVDGAILENVSVKNVDAKNVGCAIFIRLGQRNRDVPKDTPLGKIRNVVISNVNAEISFDRADIDYDLRGPGLNAFFNPIPASITGLPDAFVENVILENITISYPGRANKGLAYRPHDQLFLVPQVRDAYPEYTMFGELPSWGLFVRHVKGITLKDISFKTRANDFRPAMVFDDVNGVNLSNVALHADNDIHLVLHNAKEVKTNHLLALDKSQQLVPLSSSSILYSND